MATLKYDVGLLAGEPIKKEVEYTHGETGEKVVADVYIKQAGLARVHGIGRVEEDGSLSQEGFAKLIASTIVNEEGAAIFTTEDVATLKTDLIVALIKAINESQNEKKPKKLPRKKK